MTFDDFSQVEIKSVGIELAKAREVLNKTSLDLLNNLNILKKLKKNDYTSVKKIKVFGINNASPLVWDYKDSNTK